MNKTKTPLAQVQIGNLVRVSNDQQMNAYGKVVSKVTYGDFVALTCTDTSQHQDRSCAAEKGFVVLTTLDRETVEVVTLETVEA